MRRFFRVTVAICLGLLCLILIGVGAGYLWLRTSLPTTEGTLTLEGPSAPIEVTRDSHGIPHIRADSPADAYFALGFVHAQDRMWQMEMTRRLGTGRLAEIGGERFLPRDRAMLTLGLSKLAEESFVRISPETRAALESYADGVNAWIAGHKGALPLEFYLVGVRPKHWTPVDSLLWGRLMGMRLAGNWRAEALRARLFETMAPDRVRALWPRYPADGPVTVPAPPKKSGARPEKHRLPRATAGAFPSLSLADALLPAAGSASNSWVVAGSRTASGKPVLAGDPHLGFRSPNLWYLARIDAPGLTVSGATLPGVPFHILGHNGVIAWTMTTTGADTEDLVIETPDPADPGRYLTPTGPLKLATRTEPIAIKGGRSVIHTIRSTRNGPVVSDLDGRAGAVGAGSAVVSLRSAALEANDRTADALYLLNRAGNWREFQDALALFHSPVQNFIYADREGHIGFQVAGRIPMRKNDNGFAPVPGDSEAHEWTGFIPFDELPRLRDPDSGTIVNANNRVAGPGYGHLIARDWDKPYRAQRIVDLLAGESPHDIADSRAMQLDTLSLAAREIIPVLLAATPPSEATAEARRLLESWDGEVLRSRPQPLIFNAWLREASAAILADDLGPLFRAYRGADPLFLRYVIESDPSWCDDVATTPEETCGAVLSAALERALERLGERFGRDISLWRWGDAHVARFRHPPLGPIPLIGRLANTTIATDGDDDTLNRGTTRLSSARTPFAHVHGATFRAIYDFSDLDRSLFIQPTGQSGNPFSPHYRDLVGPWRDGDYVTMPARPEGEVRRLRIVPGEP